MMALGLSSRSITKTWGKECRSWAWSDPPCAGECLSDRRLHGSWASVALEGHCRIDPGKSRSRQFDEKRANRHYVPQSSEESDSREFRSLPKAVTDIEIRSGATVTACGFVYTALWTVGWWPITTTLEELWRFACEHRAEGRAGDLFDEPSSTLRFKPAAEFGSASGSAALRPLFGELLTDLCFRAPEFDALSVIHRAFSDNLGDHKVGNQLDLALLQGGRRGGHAGLVRFQVGLGLCVASPVAAVSKLVEGRHL